MGSCPGGVQGSPHRRGQGRGSDTGTRRPTRGTGGHTRWRGAGWSGNQPARVSWKLRSYITRLPENTSWIIPRCNWVGQALLHSERGGKGALPLPLGGIEVPSVEGGPLRVSLHHHGCVVPPAMLTERLPHHMCVGSRSWDDKEELIGTTRGGGGPPPPVQPQGIRHPT